MNIAHIAAIYLNRRLYSQHESVVSSISLSVLLPTLALTTSASRHPSDSKARNTLAADKSPSIDIEY